MSNFQGNNKDVCHIVTSFNLIHPIPKLPSVSRPHQDGSSPPWMNPFHIMVRRWVSEKRICCDLSFLGKKPLLPCRLWPDEISGWNKHVHFCENKREFSPESQWLEGEFPFWSNFGLFVRGFSVRARECRRSHVNLKHVLSI